MSQLFKKQFWLSAVFSVAVISGASADDLFDDSFFSDAAPVNTVEAPPSVELPAAAPAEPEAPTIDLPAPALTDDFPVMPDMAPVNDAPPMDFSGMNSGNVPPPPSFDASFPSLDLAAPKDIPPPMSAPSLDFGGGVTSSRSSGASMNMIAPPSEQILGKVSSDIFREMAEMERENNNLMLQLKREQLRSEIDALKAANRQMLFDEIERREKMTQARLEWELAQDLKRQDALERKQKAEIRQKQIEAALKREEERRIQKLKDEATERKRKEEEEKKKKDAEREELKKKYEAASIVRLNDLKPTLMAVTRPLKVTRSPSSRVSQQLTAAGEDLLTRKKAGLALTTPEDAAAAQAEQNRESASALYTVSEIRGTAGSLIAKLISKKDRTSFFVKKATILPTGHTVIDIDKDYVLVQIGRNKEMIGFPSAGLLGDNAPASAAAEPPPPAPAPEAQNPDVGGGSPATSPMSGRSGGARRVRFSGVSLAR